MKGRHREVPFTSVISGERAWDSPRRESWMIPGENRWTLVLFSVVFWYKFSHFTTFFCCLIRVPFLFWVVRLNLLFARMEMIEKRNLLVISCQMIVKMLFFSSSTLLFKETERKHKLRCSTNNKTLTTCEWNKKGVRTRESRSLSQSIAVHNVFVGVWKRFFVCGKR